MSGYLCPSDQPTKNLGCLFSLILFSNKNSLQKSNNIARCFVPCVRFMCSDFNFSTAAQVYITLCKKVLNPFSVSHCPLCNKMIKYDLSTDALRPQPGFAIALSTLALVVRHVHLFDFVQLLSLPVRIPSRPAVLCTTSRKHSSWSTGMFP